jgi:hypothetical protein
LKESEAVLEPSPHGRRGIVGEWDGCVESEAANRGVLNVLQIMRKKKKPLMKSISMSRLIALQSPLPKPEGEARDQWRGDD